MVEEHKGKWAETFAGWMQNIVDSSELLERCLLEMQEKGFQSDDRFTRQYVESKLANKSHGPVKILAGLFNRGIPREQANLVLNELGDQEMESRRQRLMWISGFNQVP